MSDPINGREPQLHQDSEITGNEPMLGGDRKQTTWVGIDWAKPGSGQTVLAMMMRYEALIFRSFAIPTHEYWPVFWGDPPSQPGREGE